MKIGIIGGIGPASTLDYYNGIIANCLNAGKSYPEIVIDSIDMTRMCGYFEQEDYSNALAMVVSVVHNLKNAGAEYAAIASNTPHIIFDGIKNHSPLPLVSIVEETCRYISDKGYKKVLALGTAFTMKSGLYAKSLEKYGIEAVAPCPEDIEKLHGIIFPNLENGIVIAEDKAKMISISERYIKEHHAVGECSHTGVHGNNRLASNSLLEALVFARQATTDIAEKIRQSSTPLDSLDEYSFTQTENAPTIPHGLRTEIRHIMQKAYFVIPNMQEAVAGFERISEIKHMLEAGGYTIDSNYVEAKSLATVAYLILKEVI